jgi:hypothetical protein
MQMASSSAAYLLPGSTSSIGSKSTLMKQTLPPPLTAMHSVHQVAQHQLQHPIHRSSASSHSHQPFSRTIPSGDTFHSLTVPNNNNNSTSLLTTNANHTNNTSSVLTSNNSDDNGGGSSGHSLSQSMESINNIGLTDDEVSTTKRMQGFNCRHMIRFISLH